MWTFLQKEIVSEIKVAALWGGYDDSLLFKEALHPLSKWPPPNPHTRSKQKHKSWKSPFLTHNLGSSDWSPGPLIVTLLYSITTIWLFTKTKLQTNFELLKQPLVYSPKPNFEHSTTCKKTKLWKHTFYYKWLVTDYYTTQSELRQKTAPFQNFF